MSKKYLCIGGFVYSQNDGDRHWVGAYLLPRLYGVDPQECVFWSGIDGRALIPTEYKQLKNLRPDPKGVYHAAE